MSPRRSASRCLSSTPGRRSTATGTPRAGGGRTGTGPFGARGPEFRTRQVGTITDLHYEQVLGNLASYHCSSDVLPHCAVVGTGGTAVTDQGRANVELEWDARTITRELLGLGASREVQEQWTLAPVVNP